MTEKLFYEDAYAKELVSRITKIIDNKVFLDKTIFYPQAGGEPGDTGFIENYRVIDTQTENGKIAHILEEEPSDLKIGQEVSCRIDWERRHRLMRIHTAMHLLFNVCQELLDPNVKCTGSNIAIEKGRIDLSYEPTITPELRKKLEDRCNELIEKNLLVKIWWDPERKGFRWTQIGNLPKLPCGGLHVKSLKELGSLRIIKRESKGKGKQRLEITVL
jgi:alanyl-tRNA synthetase